MFALVYNRSCSDWSEAATAADQRAIGSASLSTLCAAGPGLLAECLILHLAINPVRCGRH